MNSKFFLLAGCITALLAVILGAFGAHGLEKLVNAKTMDIYQTGVEYQFYHSFALITVGILMQLRPSKWLKPTGISFLVGILIFSGSLYLYTLTGRSSFGMITPIGGLSFIAGWVLLIIAISKSHSS